MYIRAAKTEAEEAGISTEGMANSVSELREEILSLTGNRVDIMLDDDSFKSTYQIIKELSEVWGSLSETTKSNITELIGGGVRNANVINALMTNMSTAAEVVEKTSNSAGSALNENAIVLESIQGKINVLKAKFEELSQSIISSGFVKSIVDFGSGLLNILLDIGALIEKLGGLNNILMITAGVIAVIKADAIVSVLGKILAGIVGIIPALKAFILKLIELPLALRIAKAEGQGLAAALDLVGISASTAQIAIAALVAVLTVAIIATNSYNQKLAETRRSNIDNAKAAQEEADSLRDLIDQYKELARAEKWDETARDQVKSIQEQITKLVGAQASNLDLVNGKLDEEIKKLDEIALKTAEGNTGKLEVGKKSAEDSLKQSVYANKWNSWAQTAQERATINVGAYAAASEIRAVQAVLKEMDLNKYWGSGNGIFQIDISSIDSILQSYNDMIKLREHLAMNYKEEISTGGDLDDFYDELDARIKQMSKSVEDYNNAISAYNQNEAVKELGKYLQSNDIDSKEDFDNYIDGVQSSTEYSEAYKAVLIELAIDTFPQFAEAVRDTAYNTSDGVDNTKKELTGLSDSITNLQDAYTILNKSMEEMDDGGLSADTIKKIAAQVNNLTDYLYVENGAIKLNTDAWREYAQAKIISDISGIQSSLQTLKNEKTRLEERKKAIEYMQKIGGGGKLWDYWITKTDNAIAECNDEISENQELLDIYNSIFESITESSNQATTANNQFIETLSGVSTLGTGFSQLSTIINDIKDGGNFNWSSIFNNEEFSNTFGHLGNVYTDFIETVANSPDDLSACQDAFNKLSTAYVLNSDALESVTDDTRNVAAAMLEQMGVTNAAAVVDAKLAYNKEYLKYESEECADAILLGNDALWKECEAGSVASQALTDLVQQKLAMNAATIDTSSDIEHLINMAGHANATTESIQRLIAAKELLLSVDSYMSEYEMMKGVNPHYATYLLQRAKDVRAEAEKLINTPIDYESHVKGLINFEFSGNDAVEDAKEAQHRILENAKASLDELIEYRVDMLKQDIENEKDALNEKLDALKEFYDKQKEMLQDQRDEDKYLDDQAEKRKAVTDIQSELAMLANDDSAWAQKRKLELREELSDAEKELSEFEKDHALDITLDMLDEQQEAQEKQLQKQIDALDERLNDPHALYNQALADIKNNTYSLYQEMISYNRKYGSGNDDDVSEMWNDAYEANKDYKNKTGAEYKGIHLGNYSASDASVIGKVSAVSATLKQGSSGNGVKALQHALNQLGFGNSGTKSLDGSFGKNTKSAVIAFQRAHGLSPDGSVGPATKAKFKALGYAMGTASATQGIHRVDELGTEYVFESPSDGTRYRMFQGGEKVLTAKATDFLYRFANSDGGILTNLISDILDRVNLGSVSRLAQVIEVNTGDVIVQGNANMQTVSAIRREQRKNVDYILREFNRLSK